MNHFKSAVKMGLEKFTFLFFFIISYNRLLAKITKASSVLLTAKRIIKILGYYVITINYLSKSKTLLMKEKISPWYFFTDEETKQQLPEYLAICKDNIPVLLNLEVSIWKGENSRTWFIILIPYKSP